jgi:hypothetical protein
LVPQPVLHKTLELVPMVPQPRQVRQGLRDHRLASRPLVLDDHRIAVLVQAERVDPPRCRAPVAYSDARNRIPSIASMFRSISVCSCAPESPPRPGSRTPVRPRCGTASDRSRLPRSLLVLIEQSISACRYSGQGAVPRSGHRLRSSQLAAVVSTYAVTRQ